MEPAGQASLKTSCVGGWEGCAVVLLRNCNLPPPAGLCVRARGGENWAFLDAHEMQISQRGLAARFVPECFQPPRTIKGEQPHDNYLKTPALHKKPLRFLDSAQLELFLPAPL